MKLNSIYITFIDIYYFTSQVKQLKVLADFLPSSADFKLDPAIYEMVLYDFLQTDAEGK